ncbi:MAG: glutamine-hydrolyzing GMP synthase, partial [Candidatus Gracilibacteria bacterium]
ADFEKNIYGIQFHPEVTHTPCGMKILENFVKITKAKKQWNIENYIEFIKKEIKEKVKNKKVFMLVSGGVDSTVAFALLEKALGNEKIYGLFVDTGFMRKNERAEVVEGLKLAGIKNLHVKDASKEYFEALKGVYEPEQKRKIIGDLFLTIKDQVSSELKLNPNEWIMGQGTIYPDTIETGGTKHADKIKTHHNRIDKIQELIKQGKVIEPICQLYKDEVRTLGKKLKLAEHLVSRHPFPGPGLAVRCLCAKSEDYPENYLAVEKAINNIVKKSGLKAKILPIKSVGVQGDERTYRHPVCIYGKVKNWEILSKISTQLTNKFPEINRVILGLNIPEKINMTIQNGYLTKARIDVLSEADDIVMNHIRQAGIFKDIWQFPTVLIPVSIDGGTSEKSSSTALSGNFDSHVLAVHSESKFPCRLVSDNFSEVPKYMESVVLRPVCSEEAMTANFYRMDFKKLEALYKKLIATKHLSGVFYDITNKPPATIEWE